MLKSKFVIPLLVLALTLGACNIPPTATPPPNGGGGGQTIFDGGPIIVLEKTATNASTVFNTVGQAITYEYKVRNSGSSAAAGPVAIQDNKITGINCPGLNTIGNLDGNLDLNEVLTCTATYNITQADLDAGKVTNVATATVSGIVSNQVSITVTLSPQTKKLSLTKTANPTVYSQVGQVITYTYTIQNSGTTTLGPAQFTVKDNYFNFTINCGGDQTTLAPSQTVSCSANYSITQADMNVASVTNNAVANGGGAEQSPAVSATISRSAPSSNLTKGSTITHIVEKGEWMYQIVRCYGADFTATRNANPQIANPRFIKPGWVLTVPNIGSDGRIFGKPCIGYHIVQSGETWNTIAQKYNADYDVLLEANWNVAFGTGACVRIPLNSAGGATPAPPALSACSGGVVVTPTQPSNEPIRIYIPAGTDKVSFSNTLSPTGKIRYVINLNQNQILDIKVTAPANEVAMAVYGPNGATLKPLDTNLVWTYALTTSGDYIIELAGVAGASNKGFTIEIRIIPQTS
ncbi:MAG: hypothetical protein C3F07_03385 [Anaerolineales bacterium]|nr:LysM peptidoglycan-binding domain-containing protein [Anaerolineae bacterium]PWB76639.1 MAG: hypothetical protein C3F07_03385 [Anaerolineales bacterium]